MKAAPARRRSRQKKSVLTAVNLLANHPTAEEVFFKAREETPTISISTVYRNLRILVDEGKLVSIQTPGSEAHYDHNKKDHYHIQCRICGKLIDIDVPLLDLKTIRPRNASGFIVDEVCVTFKGLCRDCKSKTVTEGAE